MWNSTFTVKFEKDDKFYAEVWDEDAFLLDILNLDDYMGRTYAMTAD